MGRHPSAFVIGCLILALSGCAGRTSPEPHSGDARFLWPVEGRISSVFGARRGSRRHLGIDIRAPAGTPIRAAASGRVVRSGTMRGYGHVVILEHPEGFETRYAHNRRNRVREGQRIEAGHVVATVGQTGNATAPHVHFEIRRRGVPQDPVRWLPARGAE